MTAAAASPRSDNSPCSAGARAGEGEHRPPQLGVESQGSASGAPGSGLGRQPPALCTCSCGLCPDSLVFSRISGKWNRALCGLMASRRVPFFPCSFTFWKTVLMTQCLSENLGNVQAKERSAWHVCGCGSRPWLSCGGQAPDPSLCADVPRSAGRMHYRRGGCGASVRTRPWG